MGRTIPGDAVVAADPDLPPAFRKIFLTRANGFPRREVFVEHRLASGGALDRPLARLGSRIVLASGLQGTSHLALRPHSKGADRCVHRWLCVGVAQLELPVVRSVA